MFITLEGTEGSGKTTQLKHISTILSSWNIRNVKTYEPGGTNIGKKIRSILMDLNNKELNPITELLLCLADRNQHIKDVIQPNISKNIVVICDRYFDSTLAYQGFARGLDLSIIRNLHDKLCYGLMPDITFIMDLDPKISLFRVKKRIKYKSKTTETRFEQEEIEFHQKIRKGYLKLAKNEPKRFYLVNASLTEKQIKNKIKSILKKIFYERLI